jgi:hypothetical protein
MKSTLNLMDRRGGVSVLFAYFWIFGLFRQ